MNTKNKLRNTVIRKLQFVSAHKLKKVDKQLGKIDKQVRTRERTLKLAGSWRKLDAGVLKDLTVNLHRNRSKDRSPL